MSSYPSFRYRDGQSGLESVRVNNPQHEEQVAPAADGWRHSPDKNAPPSMDPELVKARAHVKGEMVFFPSVRYRTNPETGRLETAIVKSAEDEAANYPAEDGWRDTPDAQAEAPLPTPPVATPPPSPAFDPNKATAPTTPEQDAADAAEIHAMKASDVIARVTQLQEPASLMRVHALEATHPKSKGGRKQVLSAINARMVDLAEQAKAKAEAGE